MKVLGIETATPTGSVALIDDEEIISEYTYQGGLPHCKLDHSAWLMPAMDKLLKDAGLSCQDIEGIAVSSGPGSFTGLRIGVSTAKGLAQGLKIPVIGISTLDSLACNLPYTEKIICPVLDARKKEIYTALYKGSQRLTDYLVIPPQQIIEIISQPTIFLGNGLKLYHGLLKESLPDVYFAPSSLWLPRASNLALLGLKDLKAGKQEDIYSFAPFYLRKGYV
ncbi:MAG: tRNA (adenosine(37)-N6)-threonylcarbamoyltransferase complex dimerization subunit type 1 TsaB [bacterium]|nr:tRNA (adenosine(37)-N6)-threonylcarbamoyltransferase complex dimerization subunit type 1 TsaB [bacterium]